MWCVENDHADIELRRKLGLDVMHEAPSRIASISSVVKDGLGISCIILTEGQDSASSLRAARLRLMAMRVAIRQPVLKTTIVE